LKISINYLITLKKCNNFQNIFTFSRYTFNVPTNPCWVGVYIATANNADNGYFFQETIQPGQPKTIDVPAGTAQVVVTFGASENIEFKLDDQKVEFNPNNTGIGLREIHMNLSYAAQTGQSEVTQP